MAGLTAAFREAILKLTILGATGKTGRLIVEKAQAEGHKITVLVRDPRKLATSDKSLKVVDGSVEDLSAIRKAISGTDAIISAVGSGHGTLEALATNLVTATAKGKSKRFVSLVGAGVSELGDPSSFGRSVMLGLMRLLARHVLEDAERHAEVIRASRMNWILVRPPRLTDGPETGNLLHDEHLTLGPSASISRADLAAFMLKLATKDEYLRSSPMVCQSR